MAAQVREAGCVRAAERQVAQAPLAIQEVAWFYGVDAGENGGWFGGPGGLEG